MPHDLLSIQRIETLPKEKSEFILDLLSPSSLTVVAEISIPLCTEESQLKEKPFQRKSPLIPEQPSLKHSEDVER